MGEPMGLKIDDLFRVVTGVLGLIAGVLSDEDETNADAGDVARAIANAGSVIAMVMTEHLSDEVFEVEARGAVAVQLASIGIDADHPPAWVSAIKEAVLLTAAAANRAGRP